MSYPKVQAGPHLGRSYARVDPAGPRPAEGWPVILLLHGAGERGDDPSRALTWRPRFPQDGGFQAILVAPQCRRGQRWVEVDWRARRPADPLHTVVDPELDFALACLDEVLAGDEGDRDRVHAVGLSMGGFGTWHLGAVAPERFASFTPICGGGQPRMAERYGGRRLFVTHGDADRVVPLVASTQMLQALAEVGVEAERILFEGVGHAAWTPTFASERWRDWLAEGKR